MSRYLFGAILALIGLMTVRGVNGSWNLLGQLDRSRAPISANPAAAENGTAAEDSMASTDDSITSDDASNLAQAGQNVLRQTSEEAAAITAQGQTVPGSGEPFTDSNGETAAPNNTATSNNNDAIPALW